MIRLLAKLPTTSPTEKPWFRSLHPQLIKSHRLAHGALDEETLDILPVFLEQTDKEIDCQHDVVNELILGHFQVSDGDTHAENLLELELDG